MVVSCVAFNGRSDRSLPRLLATLCTYESARDCAQVIAKSELTSRIDMRLRKWVFVTDASATSAREVGRARSVRNHCKWQQMDNISASCDLLAKPIHVIGQIGNSAVPYRFSAVPYRFEPLGTGRPPV